jgi:hypothetical protein
MRETSTFSSYKYRRLKVGWIKLLIFPLSYWETLQWMCMHVVESLEEFYLFSCNIFLVDFFESGGHMYANLSRNSNCLIYSTNLDTYFIRIPYYTPTLYHTYYIKWLPWVLAQFFLFDIMLTCCMCFGHPRYCSCAALPPNLRCPIGEVSTHKKIYSQEVSLMETATPQLNKHNDISHLCIFNHKS